MPHAQDDGKVPLEDHISPKHSHQPRHVGGIHIHACKASTKLKSQLTSAPEGKIVAVWVTALAVQRGGDRGGGGRGNVLRRGAGGQMVMIAEGGWHRHVGRFRWWYLHRGIDGGTNAGCARFVRGKHAQSKVAPHNFAR